MPTIAVIPTPLYYQIDKFSIFVDFFVFFCSGVAFFWLDFTICKHCIYCFEKKWWCRIQLQGCQLYLVQNSSHQVEHVLLGFEPIYPNIEDDNMKKKLLWAWWYYKKYLRYCVLYIFLNNIQSIPFSINFFQILNNHKYDIFFAIIWPLNLLKSENISRKLNWGAMEPVIRCNQPVECNIWCLQPPWISFRAKASFKTVGARGGLFQTGAANFIYSTAALPHCYSQEQVHKMRSCGQERSIRTGDAGLTLPFVVLEISCGCMTSNFFLKMQCHLFFINKSQNNKYGGLMKMHIPLLTIS